MSRLSTVARSNFSPARNVRSTVAPVLTFLRRVRTKAEPLPGFTCRNSITVQSWPSMRMVTPLRKSFEEITLPDYGVLRRLSSFVARGARLPADAVFGAVAQAFDVLAVAPDDDDRRRDAIGQARPP